MKYSVKYPKNSRILGVDVGITGGLALLVNEKILDVITMPIITTIVGKNKLTGTPKKRNKYNIEELVLIFKDWKPDLVVIERVNPMPSDGVIQAGSLLEGLGILRTIPVVLGIPVELITPAVWKKYFFEPKSSKEESRLKCIELFPQLLDKLALKGSHGLAEAALLAFYAQVHLLETVCLKS